MKSQAIVALVEKILSIPTSYVSRAGLLDQLKRESRNASKTIFQMMKGADLQRQKNLVGILGELDDTSVVNDLYNLIADPSVDDEVKLEAMVVLKNLNIDVNVETLWENLHDPNKLGDKVIESLIVNSDNPDFLVEFLEDSRKQPKEIIWEMLKSMTKITNEPRLLNSLDPLSAFVDDEVKLSIIPVIAQSNHPSAFSVLQRIIRRSTNKQVQAAAQQAIFQLGRNLSDHPTVERPKNRVFKAQMSSVDGDGSFFLFFSIKTADDQVICLDVVTNVELGIKDSLGFVESEHGYKNFMKNFDAKKELFLVEVPPSIVVEKMKAAEELTCSLKRPLPLEYLAYRKILDEVNYSEDDGKEVTAHYEKYYQEAVLQKDVIFPKLAEMFNFQEIVISWFIEKKLIGPFVEKLNLPSFQINNKPNEKEFARVTSVLKHAYATIFTDEYRLKLKKQLLELAFVSFIGNKKALAELAIVAAETILQQEAEKHPFLTRMVFNSVAVFIAEGMYGEMAGEDSFEDDDDDAVNIFDQHPKNMFEFPLALPEGKALPCFEKLLFLAQKLPRSQFARDFNPHIVTADLATKIKHVNYLQTAFNQFVTFHIGYYDWDELRKHLDIPRRHKYTDSRLKSIEDALIDEMKENQYHKYFVDNARRIWSEAILLSDGKLPMLNNGRSWVAAVEYLVGCLNNVQYSKAEIARYYEISTPTLNKRVDILKTMLNIHVYTIHSDKYEFLNSTDNHYKKP